MVSNSPSSPIFSESPSSKAQPVAGRLNHGEAEAGDGADNQPVHRPVVGRMAPAPGGRQQLARLLRQAGQHSERDAGQQVHHHRAHHADRTAGQKGQGQRVK